MTMSSLEQAREWLEQQSVLIRANRYADIAELAILLDAVKLEARIDEAFITRSHYHGLEERERQLKFVEYMDRRCSELEDGQ